MDYLVDCLVIDMGLKEELELYEKYEKLLHIINLRIDIRGGHTKPKVMKERMLLILDRRKLAQCDDVNELDEAIAFHTARYAEDINLYKV